MSEDTPSKDGLIFFESPEASRLLQMRRSISKANATIGSTSLGQFSINSTDSLVSIEEPDDSVSSRSVIDSKTRELVEKAAKADRKLESQMLIEYVKDYQMIETKSPRTLLKTSQGKRKDEGRLSLANAEKFVKNLAQQNSQTNASANQIPDKTPSSKEVKDTPRIKRDRKVSLNSQFRRKSCHCSECGGMSKLELKAQNIVKAANKHLEWVQYIRKKNKQKAERQKGLFLNLPQFNTLVLSRRESKEGTPRSMTSKKTGQSSPKSKFFSVLSRHSSRNLLLTRGSETPLRKTKNEILEEAWSAVTPNQYMIKIFTPLDADKDVVDEDSGREDPKKEEEQAKSLGSPVLAKRASKQQQQKPPKQRRKRKQPTLYMEEPLVSSRRSSLRPQTTQENQNRPQVLIQKYVATVDRADSPEEFYDKMDVEVLDMNTKREMWEKIGQVSPKFKRIFGDKLYTEEPREYNEELGSPLEIKPDGSKTTRASLNSINKIYAIYRPLPKLKIPSAKPKCTTTSSRVDTAATNEVNPRSYRASSYQVTGPGPGPLERLHSIEAHLPSMEITSPTQPKSETLKNLFSIYASPKTAKSSTKHHKHTFSEIQSSRLDTLVLPSNTMTMTNIQVGNPVKGHRKNLSINTARIPSASNKIMPIASYRESQIKTVTSPNSRRAKVPAGRNLSTGLSTKGNKEIQLQKK